MNHLVSNGTHLLRRSSHLVRTPIGVPLACDEMAVYQVADNYTNGWPSGGFIDQATYWTVQTTGRKMLDAYVNHYSTRGNIIWRKVTTSHQPEFAWYQGAYATSAQTKALAAVSCEAYMQLCAYHFTLPQTLADAIAAGLAAISGARASFVLGGEFRIDGPVYNPASRKRATWTDGTDFGYYIAAGTSLGHYADLANLPADDVSAACESALDAQTNWTSGYRDLWGFGNSERDGAIPAFSSPPTVSYTLGADTLAVLARNGGCWLIPVVYPIINGNTDYRPYFWPSSATHEWSCVSLWDIALSVEIA